MTCFLPGRCSIWWCWRMTPVAHRMAHDVSFVSRIVASTVFGDVGGWHLLLTALEMTFHLWPGSWQAQYLVSLRLLWFNQIGNWELESGCRKRSLFEMSQTMSKRCPVKNLNPTKPQVPMSQPPKPKGLSPPKVCFWSNGTMSLEPHVP